MGVRRQLGYSRERRMLRGAKFRRVNQFTRRLTTEQMRQRREDRLDIQSAEMQRKLLD